VIGGAPSPLDLVELPYMRTALFELALLAVAAGVLGAWIVLRRLAFFSHAVGTATFPGLVVADASGISATVAGLVPLTARIETSKLGEKGALHGAIAVALREARGQLFTRSAR